MAAHGAPKRVLDEFARGAREMLSTAIGIAAWGLITGVAMGKSGIAPWLMVMMSLLVFVGSAQLAVLPLLALTLLTINSTAFFFSCLNMKPAAATCACPPPIPPRLPSPATAATRRSFMGISGGQSAGV